MVESTRQVQSEDPYDRFEQAIADPRLYETTHQTYEFRFAETPEADLLHHDPVPLFLADNEDPRYHSAPEYAFGRSTRRKPRALRVVTCLLALSAAGAILALLSIDSTRAVIVNAKASLANVVPIPFAAAQQDAAPPAARVAAQLANVEPSTGVPDAAASRRIQPGALASASPSRDEIAAAYQTAIKSMVVAVEPETREAQPPARRIDPDELAALLKRAKSLLAIGDITSARLLLERAADAQEIEAALMLAGTYDPQVLGTQDMRSITPDPATARLWYQKAAQLGSSDAKRRLSQIQN
jgi:hypothetical protein